VQRAKRQVLGAIPRRVTEPACVEDPHQSQYTIVIPSQDLVIVKIGWAYTPNDDRIAVERLVRETIAALQSGQS
jgi:hypothetical protein